MFLKKRWNKLRKRSKKDFFTVSLILFLAVIINAAASAAHHTLLQQGIAEEVLRFHVLANSDSETDQQVKLKVRNAVLRWMEENHMEEGEKTGESRQDKEGRAGEELFVENSLEEIEGIADQVLKEQGFSYRSSAALEDCYFPRRTYGDYTFPAGWYRALRIQLGKGEGHNWWCILYPNLCFSDCLEAVTEEEEKKKLEEILTAQEYRELLRSPRKWKIEFRWF